MDTTLAGGLIVIGIIMLLLIGMLFYVLFKMITSVSSTENYLCKNCYSETGKNDMEQKAAA